jgi:hypothetical protein
MGEPSAAPRPCLRAANELHLQCHTCSRAASTIP